jgi:hypothetical protein
MISLLIEDAKYDVPEEEDWTLGELAEFQRLRDRWGTIGATIALVWIVKHRENPMFTVEQAEAIKVNQLDEVEVPAGVPLTSSDGSSATDSSLRAPSEIPEGSGLPTLESTTA